MKKPMKGEDIAERLLDFAARIVKLADALPKSTVGKHLCGQVIRSGTSAGANYEEGRGAESEADFVHKLGICLKELRETRYWLKVIARTNLLPPARLSGIIQEADELCRIVGKSIMTVKRRMQDLAGGMRTADKQRKAPE